jgi:thymidylate synthase (FAD)
MTVELVTYTPNPVEIVGRAAGICWDKEEKEDYPAFVRRVVKMGHTSVIEHAVFTFRVDGVSRALTHQWVRHRICSFSQRSQRFIKERNFDYIVPPSIDRSGTFHFMIDNSYGNNVKPVELSLSYDGFMKLAGDMYDKYLGVGIKGEDARFVLPNACETKMYWTINARALRNFFKLRLSIHAQWEIRAMAGKMYDLVVAIAPALFDDMQNLRDTGVK